MTKLASEFAEDFAKLMDVWNNLEALVKRDYPELTDDERYAVTSRAMNEILCIK